MKIKVMMPLMALVAIGVFALAGLTVIHLPISPFPVPHVVPLPFHKFLPPIDPPVVFV